MEFLNDASRDLGIITGYAMKAWMLLVNTCGNGRYLYNPMGKLSPVLRAVPTEPWRIHGMDRRICWRRHGKILRGIGQGLKRFNLLAGLGGALIGLVYSVRRFLQGDRFGLGPISGSGLEETRRGFAARTADASRNRKAPKEDR